MTSSKILFLIRLFSFGSHNGGRSYGSTPLQALIYTSKPENKGDKSRYRQHRWYPKKFRAGPQSSKFAIKIPRHKRNSAGRRETLYIKAKNSIQLKNEIL